MSFVFEVVVVVDTSPFVRDCAGFVVDDEDEAFICCRTCDGTMFRPFLRSFGVVGIGNGSGVANCGKYGTSVDMQRL